MSDSHMEDFDKELTAAHNTSAMAHQYIYDMCDAPVALPQSECDRIWNALRMAAQS